MATSEETARVRLYIAEPEENSGAMIPDDTIDGIIDEQSGDLYSAASRLWAIKAGSVADWYNVALDGGSLSREAVFKHCMQMADYYSVQGGQSLVSILLSSDYTTSEGEGDEVVEE